MEGGFSALALRRSGVASAELRRLGYAPRALRAARVEAQQLLRLFALEDLRHAGFKVKETLETLFKNRSIYIYICIYSICIIYLYCI